MRPISSKKILIILLALITMSRWDKVSSVASNVCRFLSDSLQPFHDMPVEGRFVVALLICALLYITIFKLFHDRNERR